MNIPVIDLSGSPYEIGLTHGKTCKTSIINNLSYYLGLWNHYSGVKRNKVLDDVQLFLPFIEKIDKELIEEMKGVATGASLQFEEVLALNARWELNYAYLFPAPIKESGSGCTAIAITADRSKNKNLLMGQNWDYKPGLKNNCIVLRIYQQNKPKIIIHTEAGIIGHKGINSSGIGICMNYIRCEKDTFKPGLPVWLKVRSLLNSDTLPQCLSILMNNIGPNSANIMIGHRDGEVIDAECTPNDVYFIYPTTGILAHSNHFLSQKLRVIDSGKNLLPDTVIRSERAWRLLDRNSVNNIENMKSILKDHFGFPEAICRHANPKMDTYAQWVTLTSLVYNLKKGEFYYTSGEPCQSKYKKLSFKENN